MTIPEDQTPAWQREAHAALADGDQWAAVQSEKEWDHEAGDYGRYVEREQRPDDGIKGQQLHQDWAHREATARAALAHAAYTRAIAVTLGEAVGHLPALVGALEALGEGNARQNELTELVVRAIGGLSVATTEAAARTATATVDVGDAVRDLAQSAGEIAGSMHGQACASIRMANTFDPPPADEPRRWWSVFIPGQRG